MQMVFVPVAQGELEQLISGQDLDGERVGFSATQSLRQALEYSLDQEEELERAALVLASIWGLAKFGARLVAVAMTDSIGEASQDDHNGAVTIKCLPVKYFTAWFGDEAAADSAVMAAKQAAAGKTLDDAWEEDAVQQLMSEYDLLWHGNTEQLV